MKGLSAAVVECWHRRETPLWLWIVGVPLAGLFHAVVWLRNGAYDIGLLRRGRPGIPIVSVGNLAVGGTGKTPVTRHVVRRLLDAGRKPGIVLRGYGQDELELHRRWTPEVPVVGAPDRIQGTTVAISEGARAVVLDDAFQHRRMGRDLDIVLVAAEHPLPTRLMPLGPYRETSGALRRAHYVLLTQRTAEDSRAEAWKEHLAEIVPETPRGLVRFVGGGWMDVDGREVEGPDGPVLAVTGIAQPGAFLGMVEGAVSGEVDSMIYADHYRFNTEDAARILEEAGDRPVATTEKDAVKLEEFGELARRLRVLRLELEWVEGSESFYRLLDEATAGAEL